jgi:hypothetical protein
MNKEQSKSKEGMHTIKGLLTLPILLVVCGIAAFTLTPFSVPVILIVYFFFIGLDNN